jgi:hypothetical protein
MRILRSFLCGLAFLAGEAFGVELVDQEISMLGSHTGETIFMYLKSSALTTHQCSNQVLYCSNTNPDCKSMLSLALAAKMSSSKVYVVFERNGQGRCEMTHIRI